MDPTDVPKLDAVRSSHRLVKNPPGLPTMVTVDFVAARGKKLRLCDFASAGAAGTPYRSWLEVDSIEKVRFSRANPLRSGRPRR